MSKSAKYHLGRVIKLGILDNEKLIEAIRDPVVIIRGKYQYSFTDISYVEGVAKYDFIFAKLTKFFLEGEIEVVQPERHVATPADVPNLLFASSAFVYIPHYSGIAYQQVWNKIQKAQFERVFADLIESKHGNMFVNSKIEPITDLRTFVQRISEFDSIHSMEAKVNPPNPLFGPAWKSLRDYLKRRNLSELKIKEEGQSNESIGTNVAKIAREVLKNEEIGIDRLTQLLEPYEGGIADAAVLMAADGYGNATIEGTKNTIVSVVRTTENQISIQHQIEPDPVSLAEEVIKILERITKERYLDH